MSEELKAAQLKQVVALSLANVPEYKIAEEMNLSRYAVSKIRKSDEFKNQIKEAGDNSIGIVRDRIRSKLDGMIEDFLQTIHENLKNRKLEAARLYAEITGLKSKDEEKQGDTHMMVIMPGADTPKDVIDVKSEQ